ncbi:hypothetical protein BN970_03548 [Mycolicibacterium conceptionense]|uniref:Uncharacterized protein n=1 Tax=Mycolicibacterium conceptionense TaxID=451644 RepID=A0A0U1DHE4_9MYCO|nr:hypothetical protein [Mycolicibacterium conceptionense]ORV24653.1 hypothetical protein AWB98_20650 [Mycolicibacterium conceptionense]CQD16627.1 hypothetical protein BN970_03548 [Mycolicibacterium conceptionense]
MTQVRAWRLPGGALACAANPAIGAWDGRVVNLNASFAPPVDERTALRELAAIYPANNQVTDIHYGSCEARPVHLRCFGDSDNWGSCELDRQSAPV